jgi:hypothetical protein
VRRKLAVLFGTLAVIVGFVLPATPAYAQSAVEIGTNQGGSALCMNRQGGGDSIGTFIIGYNCGVDNNDFEYQAVPEACGNGEVTSTCPFSNTAIDAVLDGAPIVNVWAYDENLCAGTASLGTFTLRLEACSNNKGLGGGANNTWVAPGLSDTGNAFNCLISINTTNYVNNGNHFYNAVETGYEGGIAITTGNTTYSQHCGPYPSGAQWKELYY